MPHKEEAVHYVHDLAQHEVLTRKELLEAYESGIAEEKKGLMRQLTMSQLLYYVGGGIVFLGVCILLAQNWSILNSTTKTLVTLGGGVLCYVVAAVLARDDKLKRLATPFFLLFALLSPLGMGVMLDQMGVRIGYGMQSVIAFSLFIVCGASLYIHKAHATLFALFSVLFGTWFYFSMCWFLIQDSSLFQTSTFFEYQVLVVGFVYALLGYFAYGTKLEPLRGLLYGFGLLGFLGAAFALGGWNPNQNAIWEVAFPGIVFFVLYMSVYLKSNSFLVFGTLFLMAYIMKITSEYFTEGLGWPLALVLAGLAIIAVGYMSFELKKKYLKA